MTLPSLADVHKAEPHPAGEAELDEHLQLILKSPVFEKTGTLRTLLTYLWEHRGQPISEYAVATEALGKKSDFEPRIDASVRVRISRLRQKLEEFYQGPGLDTEIRFAIPLGGHDLHVTRLVRERVEVVKPQIKRPVISILTALLIATAGACVLLAWDDHKVRQSLSEGVVTARQALPPFWQNFFSNGKPASLFVSTPIFFDFPGNNIKVRDTTVNDFEKESTSPLLHWLTKQWGQPKLLQNYTVASDTFAALRLAQYLQNKNVQLLVAGTAELSVESAGDRNIILIGVAGTCRQVNEILNNGPFYIADGATHSVQNRAPQPGEPAVFNTTEESTFRSVRPGIIAVLPGKVPGTRLLVLTGFYTYPLVYSLATPSPLTAVDTAWKNAGSPRFFEAIINSEVEASGTSVLRSSVVAFRAIDAKN
jgi:hypothetical protein